MNDEPFYSPRHKPAQVRLGKPGERLFEFQKGQDHYACEPRDHGELA